MTGAPGEEESEIEAETIIWGSNNWNFPKIWWKTLTYRAKKLHKSKW